MSREDVSELKPFISVIVLIVTLFTMAFCKTEVRRMGYVVWKELRLYRQESDRLRLRTMEYAKLTNPHRVNAMAQARLTLNEAEWGQIIQMSGKQIAIRQ